MASAPSSKQGLLSGLARILHLHQLPQPTPPSSSFPQVASASTTSALFLSERNTRSIMKEIPPISDENPLPLSTADSSEKKLASSLKKDSPTPSASLSQRVLPFDKWPNTPRTARTLNQPARKGMIITDYDRILDLVQEHHTIKLDEIARVLSMKEEQVAQELQTLEDNGLVEVKYPAFGEPLIYYKTPED